MRNMSSLRRLSIATVLNTTLLLALMLSGSPSYVVSQSSVTTYYVSTFGAGAQCSQSRPCQSLTSALKLAVNGDTIVVGAGVYGGESNVNITISNSIEILGQDGASVIFQCGTTTGSFGWKLSTSNTSLVINNIVFSGCDAGLVLEGGTILKASTSGATAGSNFVVGMSGANASIRNLNIAPLTGTALNVPLFTLNNTNLVLFQDKSATVSNFSMAGPVLQAASSHVIIEGVSFYTTLGDVYFIETTGDGGSLTLANLSLTGSKAQALKISAITTVRLDRCSISENSYSITGTATGAALAMTAAGSSVRATNCHFDNNFFTVPQSANVMYTGYGAAAYLLGADATFINCTFNGNSGPVGGTFDYGTNKYVGFQLLGGAIWVSGSQLRMQDCQVVGNFASNPPSFYDDDGADQEGIAFQCGGNSLLTWVDTTISNNHFATTYTRNEAGSAINCFSACTISVTNSNYTTGNDSPIVSGQCSGLNDE